MKRKGNRVFNAIGSNSEFDIVTRQPIHFVAMHLIQIKQRAIFYNQGLLNARNQHATSMDAPAWLDLYAARTCG